MSARSPWSLAVRVSIIALAAFAFSSCALFGGSRRVLRDCPESLVVPEQVEAGFRRDGTYRARTGDADTVLRVVLARRDATLVLVALTPIGAEAFHVVQRGEALDIEAPLRRWLGTPPELVLRDLHRIHFDAQLAASAPGVTRSAVGGGVRIERTACAHRADYEPAR